MTRIFAHLEPSKYRSIYQGIYGLLTATFRVALEAKQPLRSSQTSNFKNTSGSYVLQPPKQLAKFHKCYGGIMIHKLTSCYAAGKNGHQSITCPTLSRHCRTQPIVPSPPQTRILYFSILRKTQRPHSGPPLQRSNTCEEDDTDYVQVAKQDQQDEEFC